MNTSAADRALPVSFTNRLEGMNTVPSQLET